MTAKVQKQAKPFVKWAGGKAKLSEALLSYMPKKISTYVEPFVGGGAILFSLASQHRFKKAVLADVNHNLINTYITLKNNVGYVCGVLESLADKYNDSTDTKKLFLAARRKYNKLISEKPDCGMAAALTIFINKTCFNGLYRVNSKGVYNVSFGKYDNPKICDEQNLKLVSKVLQNTLLFCMDFEKVVLASKLKKGDVVYFDPPYYPLKKTSFTQYTKGTFTNFDHMRLSNLFKSLKKRGVFVIQTNSNTSMVRSLYKDCKLITISANRSIGASSDTRKKEKDLIIL